MNKKWRASPMAENMLLILFIILSAMELFLVWGAIFVPNQRQYYAISACVFAAMQVPVLYTLPRRVLYRVSFSSAGALKKFPGMKERLYPWSLCRIEIRKGRYEGKSLFLIFIGRYIPSEREFKKGIKAKQYSKFILMLYRREILDDILQYIPPERIIGIELVEGKDEKGKYLFKEKR